jgi:hypothetical protein
MSHSGKVSGTRSIKSNRKDSKKSSKKGSKRSQPIDFSHILNEMDDMPMQQNQFQGQEQYQQQNMEGMMPMMPNTSMEQMAMAQMAMPNMGMPQMMMGSNSQNVDPLHVYNFVPQNENLNINNFGVNQNQLISGEQMGRQFAGRSSNQMGNYNEESNQGPIMPTPAANNKYYRY